MLPERKFWKIEQSAACVFGPGGRKSCAFWIRSSISEKFPQFQSEWVVEDFDPISQMEGIVANKKVALSALGQNGCENRR